MWQASAEETTVEEPSLEEPSVDKSLPKNMPINEEDLITILVATDNHLGYNEKDPMRGSLY